MQTVAKIESKFSSGKVEPRLGGRYGLVGSANSKVKSEFESHVQNIDRVNTKNAARDGQKEVVQSLEAEILRSVVDSLMTPEDSGFLEAGMAGEFWKSIFSDQIADVITKSSQVPILDQLSFNKYKSKAVNEGI